MCALARVRVCLCVCVASRSLFFFFFNHVPICTPFLSLLLYCSHSIFVFMIITVIIDHHNCHNRHHCQDMIILCLSLGFFPHLNKTRETFCRSTHLKNYDRCECRTFSTACLHGCVVDPVFCTCPPKTETVQGGQSQNRSATSCVHFVRTVKAKWCSSSLLLYVHGDHNDYQGRGAQDIDLDFYTAPEF